MRVGRDWRVVGEDQRNEIVGIGVGVGESGTPVVSKADGRTALGKCRRLIFNVIKIRHPIGADRVC